MAQSEERRKEYQKRYREMLHEEYRDVYTLTKEEKIQMGLIQKPSVLKGNIHIVIPVHYDSRSVWWESRFVTKLQLEGYLMQYPDLQIVDKELLLRR